MQALGTCGRSNRSAMRAPSDLLPPLAVAASASAFAFSASSFSFASSFALISACAPPGRSQRPAMSPRHNAFRTRCARVARQAV